MPYSDKNGVRLRRYTEEQLEEDPAGEPYVDEQGAQLDELWFDKQKGYLVVTVDTQNDGFYHIEIPILPTESWNSFFDSLPTWN